MIINNARFLTHKITGVQRYAIEISKKLQELVSEIVFISPVVTQKHTDNIFKVNCIGNFQSHMWEQIDLPLYLQKEKNPLLLNLANTAPVFYKNQIITIHDLACLNEKWVSSKFKLFYEILLPKIINNSLKVVTVSDFSKKEIVKHFKVPENKIEVVYNAVSQEFIDLANSNYQNNYGEYILAVSSLNPRKNFKSLIQAFNKLKLKETKLLIVGEKNNIYANPQFNNIIQGNPDTIFTGYVTDKELVGLYKNAKLFVFPSLYEGFGIPPLEAMACGCPTIVSDVASIPEVCSDASYYVDPEDVNSIADGIYEILKNESLQTELRNKGFERIKAFSWQNSAEKYIDIIKEF